jgi:hypothetical protein
MNDIREAMWTLYKQSKHLCLACTMPWLGVMFKDMRVINTYLEIQTFSRADFPDEKTGMSFMESACRQRLSMDIFHDVRHLFLCQEHQKQVFPTSEVLGLAMAKIEEEVPA